MNNAAALTKYLDGKPVDLMNRFLLINHWKNYTREGDYNRGHTRKINHG